MKQTNLIADELGDIRALIRTLKMREAELRQRIIERRPNARLTGARYCVEIHKGMRRKLDIALLPEAITLDPRYFVEKETFTVRATPHSSESEEVIE